MNGLGLCSHFNVWTSARGICGWYCAKCPKYEVHSISNNYPPRLHFTVEREQGGKFPFFDVVLFLKSNNIIYLSQTGITNQIFLKDFYIFTRNTVSNKQLCSISYVGSL